jgi:hypothetical protein
MNKQALTGFEKFAKTTRRAQLSCECVSRFDFLPQFYTKYKNESSVGFFISGGGHLLYRLARELMRTYRGPFVASAGIMR